MVINTLILFNLQAGRNRGQSDPRGDEPVEFICKGVCLAPCHRILKLAHTIADLTGSEHMQTPHLADYFTLHVPGKGAAAPAEGMHSTM